MDLDYLLRCSWAPRADILCRGGIASSDLKDQNQLKKIHEEIGSDVDLEQFDKFFTYATSKPFGFLTVDFNAKAPDQTFRCCFNEYLS